MEDPRTTDTQESRFGPRRHRRRGLFPGMFLIGLGVLLLAHRMNLLPGGLGVTDFWPLLVIGFGLSRLRYSRDVTSVLFSLVFVGFGTLMMLGKLQVIPFPATVLWPVLLIVLGVGLLLGGGRDGRCGRHRRHERDSPDGDRETVSLDRLDREILMGGASLRVDSQSFRGGSLSAVMAGMEIDLHRARMPEEGATLELRAVMAGIELRVPDSWQVVCEITPILGGIEDRTQPANGGAPRPKLRITGSVVLGGVEIRN